MHLVKLSLNAYRHSLKKAAKERSGEKSIVKYALIKADRSKATFS